MSSTLGMVLLGLVLGLLAFWWWSRLRSGQEKLGVFAAVPTRQIKVDGWDLRYHISGSGPYIVLLHGIGADLHCWNRLIPLLNNKYSVVALDLPGFGQSTKPAEERFGLDDQAARVHAFLRQLHISKVNLVGSSMGGNIALWYALTYPDQVLGTVVIAPALSPLPQILVARHWLWTSWILSRVVSRPFVRWSHCRTVTNKGLVDRNRVEATLRNYQRNAKSVRSFLAAFATLNDPRFTPRLRDLKGRVLTLWGTQDNLVSHKNVRTLEAALPRHESYLHAGGGHHLQEDDPAWVTEKIDAFIAARPSP